MEINIICVQFILSLVTIFLKGFQTQSVIAKKHKFVIITSIGMSVFNVLNTVLIVENGWSSILPISVGSLIGVLLSMKLFNKVKHL